MHERADPGPAGHLARAAALAASAPAPAPGRHLERPRRLVADPVSSGSQATIASWAAGRERGVGGAPPAAGRACARSGRLGARRALDRRGAPRAGAGRPRPLDRDRVRRERRDLLEAREAPSSSRGVASPAPVDVAVGSWANSSRVERRVAAAPGARPPDHRLVARPRQRDVGEPEVLAALLARCGGAGARRTRSPSRPTSIARARRRPRRGSRRACPPRRSGPAPTGTGSRRPGTRDPCCGGWSAPARRRRPSPGAGCARRRRPRGRRLRSARAASRSAPRARAALSPAAACSSWATCSRSVSRRSPSGSESSRAGIRSPSGSSRPAPRRRCSRSTRAQRVQALVQRLELVLAGGRQLRSRPSRAAASAPRRGARGWRGRCSSACSSASQSAAARVREHAAGAADHGRDPGRSSSLVDQRRVAVGAHQHGDVARARRARSPTRLAVRRRAARSGRRADSSATTSRGEVAGDVSRADSALGKPLAVRTTDGSRRSSRRGSAARLADGAPMQARPLD